MLRSLRLSRVFGPPPTLDLANGLVFWLPFDGGNAEDQSGYNCPLQSTNGAPSQVAGFVPTLGALSAYNFNGSTDYFSYGVSGSPLPAQLQVFNTGFTMAMWIYPTVTSADLAMLGTDINSQPVFRVNSTNHLTLINSGVTVIGSSTGTITPNRWTHAAVSFLDTNGAFVFYINGVLSGSGTNAIGAFVTTASLLRVASSGVFYQGRLDDIRIYNRILPAAEVSTIYLSAFQPWMEGEM